MTILLIYFLLFPFFSLATKELPILVNGKRASSQACNTEMAEVFISVDKDKKLLFQLSVPPEGTFQLNLEPGFKYDLLAATRSGCLFEKSFSTENLKTNPEIDVEISLKKNTSRIPSSTGMSFSETQAGFCPICGFNSGINNSFPFLNSQTYLPGYSMGYNDWWSQLLPLYARGSNSCWGMQYGCSRQHYHGPGGAVMGKPNVYLRGFKEREAVDVKLELLNDTVALAVTPAQKKSHWVGTVEKSKFKSSSGGHYDYLYHDLNVDKNFLQKENGFCVSQKNLFPKLIESLKALQFNKNEIDDFTSYWVWKMPKAESYCVYPQENPQMDQMAILKLNDKNVESVRVNFLIVPQVAGVEKLEKKFREPSSTWTPKPKASTVKPRLFEWGVGFLVE